MNLSRALIDTVKKILKSRGHTYADVATILGLSEASIKRIFSEGDLSLSRLEAILDFLDLDMASLVAAMNDNRQLTQSLTVQQETVIVNDNLLLLVAVCVINGYSFKDIVEQYTISDTELIQKLAQLDRLQIIDLLPGNRIRLRISPSFSWLPHGPIQHFFHRHIKEEYFHARFDSPADKLLVVNGLMTEERSRELHRRMQALATEFTELCQQDKQMPMDKRQGTTFVLAVRHWQSQLFKLYSRR